MPESVKDRKRRWSGLVKFAKSPSHLYPLTFLLAYAVLFGLYDLRQVPKQRAAILEQSFRRLALASDQIRSRMENITQVMLAEADRISAQKPQPGSHVSSTREFLASGNTRPIKDFFFERCESKSQSQEGISFQVLPGDKPVILATLNRGAVLLCGQSPLEATIESATRDLVGTGFEDVALITSSGRVLYQNQSSALRLATLGDLPAAIKSGKSPADDKASDAGGKVAPSALAGVNYSRVTDLSFAERNYKLLLQPVGVLVSDVAQTSNPEKLPGLELVGIIDEATLTAAARSLPYDWLIDITGFLLLALVLTWPVLKILKMGPAEGFRSRETLAFGFSMIAAAMLVTLLACYNSQVFSFESTDDNLKTVAHSIDTNFKKEITAGLQTLGRVSASADVRDELRRALERKESLRFRAHPAVFAKESYFRNDTRFSAYRWFDQIFWADEQGNQILKWSTQAQATGQTKVSDEAWFQKAVQGRYWTLQCVDAKPASFVLDTVYSPNTTDYFGMLAQVQDVAGKKIVAAMVIPFVSVMNPLLSPMDGFAILDEKGVVRFHSDVAKNLRENFLNEIRPSNDVRSAVDARMPALLTATYNAKSYRIAIQPISFDGNEAWTLVVFHDLTLRQRFFLNVLVLTITYTASYLFTLAALVAIGVLLIRAVASWMKLPLKEDWLRPTANERFIVWALVALSALLLVVFRLLTGPDHRQLQYLATVLLLPLAGLLAFYFGLRYPSALGWLHRAGAAKPVVCNLAQPGCAERKAAAFRARCRIGAGSVLGIALTLLLTLVSIFPATEFFEMAFNDSTVPNMEDMQVGTARNVLARNNRIYAYVRTIPTETGTPLQPDPALLKARLSETLDRYTLPVAAKGKVRRTKLDCWLPNPTRNHWPDVQAGPRVSWLFANTAGVLKDLLPFPEAIRDGRAVEGSWRWRENGAVLEMQPPQPDPQDLAQQSNKPGRASPAEAALSTFPIVNALPAFRHQNKCGFVILALVFLLFWFTRYTVLRRFGLDLRPSSDPFPEASLPDLARDSSRNVLALNFPPSANPEAVASMNLPAAVQVFSVDELLCAADWKSLVKNCTELIVVLCFELGIKDPQKRTKTLELLEQIVDDPKRKLLLVSTLDPVYHLYSGRLRDLKKMSQAELKTYSRWLNVLNSFETRRVLRAPDTVFTREDWHTLWDACSEREQIALWQLARYCVINPKNTGAVEHLYRRGILTYSEQIGHFRVFQQGFKDFIVSELTGRQMELLMSCHKDTAWNGLKSVLIITGLALPFFLAFTTADFWDLGLGKLMTIGSAGAAALQTITKFAEMAGVKLAKEDSAE